MITVLFLTIKKTIALFALVEPLAMVPVFIAATDGLDVQKRKAFSRTIALAVTIALLVAAFLGAPFLNLLGVSIGAMQVGGGIIVLLLAIAMVLGKEASFKGSTPGGDSVQPQEASIVPLAIPLLAGPAAFSYVMGNSQWGSPLEALHVVIPIVAVGALCWLIFRIASTANKAISQSSIDIVERVSGFILAAMAIEMIAVGLRGLFPFLTK